MIKEAVPSKVKELLENQQLNGVPVLLSTTSDLSLGGEQARALDRRHSRQPRRRRGGPVGDDEPRLVSHVPHRPRRRSSARRGPSVRDSCRPTSTRPGSTSPATRTPSPRSSTSSPASWKTCAFNGEVVVHPEDELDYDALQEMRPDGWRPPSESCPRCLPRRAIVGRLWQLLRPQWPTALAMCGLMLVGVAMELVPPKLQQYLVDDILTRGEGTPGAGRCSRPLLVVVLALAATRVLLGVVNWIKGLLANKVGVGTHVRPPCATGAEAARAGGRLLRPAPGRLAGQPRRLRQRGAAQPAPADHRRLPAADRPGGRRRRHALHAQPQAGVLHAHPRPAGRRRQPVLLEARSTRSYYRYWDSSSKQAGTLSGMLSGIRVVKAFAQEHARVRPVQPHPATTCGSRA